MRPSWKGDLVLGHLRVPAELFSAGDPPGRVSFNQAHRCSSARFTRLQTKRWCPNCECEVAGASVRRVLERAEGRYLEVTDAELAACEAAPSRDMAVIAVSHHLNPLFIETTSSLRPADDAARAAFHTVVSALGSRVAIAELVLNKRRVVVGLQNAGFGVGLALFHLRNEAHVRTFVATTSMSPEISRGNVQAAKDALERLAEQPFDIARIGADSYYQAVTALVTRRLADATKADLQRSSRKKRA